MADTTPTDNDNYMYQYFVNEGKVAGKSKEEFKLEIERNEAKTNDIIKGLLVDVDGTPRAPFHDRISQAPLDLNLYSDKSEQPTQLKQTPTQHQNHYTPSHSSSHRNQQPMPTFTDHKSRVTTDHRKQSSSQAPPIPARLDPATLEAANEFAREKLKRERKRVARAGIQKLMANNVPLTRKFDPLNDNNVTEMEEEVTFQVTTKRKEKSIEMYQKLLMFGVKGLEYTNEKWNPFDFELEGWANQVSSNITDFDDIMEDLYDKYKTKGGSWPPELRLAFALAISAGSWHGASKGDANSGFTKAIKKNPNVGYKLVNGIMKGVGGQGNDHASVHGKDEDDDHAPIPTNTNDLAAQLIQLKKDRVIACANPTKSLTFADHTRPHRSDKFERSEQLARELTKKQEQLIDMDNKMKIRERQLQQQLDILAKQQHQLNTKIKEYEASTATDRHSDRYTDRHTTTSNHNRRPRSRTNQSDSQFANFKKVDISHLSPTHSSSLDITDIDLDNTLTMNLVTTNKYDQDDTVTDAATTRPIKPPTIPIPTRLTSPPSQPKSELKIDVNQHIPTHNDCNLQSTNSKPITATDIDALALDDIITQDSNKIDVESFDNIKPILNKINEKANAIANTTNANSAVSNPNAVNTANTNPSHHDRAKLSKSKSKSKSRTKSKLSKSKSKSKSKHIETTDDALGMLDDALHDITFDDLDDDLLKN
ncbi:Hypothetical protein MVR_LOCUS238 [uncultured virus]|nr:Hypothetical protein MVR_LOCUS238 [uncultured virus]